MRSNTLALPVAALVALTAGNAQAAFLHALTSDGKLITIDSEQRRAKAAVPVSTMAGRVVAIAMRPSDGKLYGLTDTHQLVTIDATSGRVSMGPKLDKALETGTRLAINFNPVVDRLRVVGISGTNYRINVDSGAVTADGTLKYTPASPYAATPPRVTAAAYTNHVAGTKETALYTIDTLLGQINLQMPPNEGVQQPKKGLDGRVPNGIGFDIVSDGQGGNTGYLVAGGKLFTIAVADLDVSDMGPIAGLPGGEVVSLAAASQASAR